MGDVGQLIILSTPKVGAGGGFDGIVPGEALVN